ncbi:hypothetical protein ABZU53_06510 [Micromonospora sp. NPDC005194]
MAAESLELTHHPSSVLVEEASVPVPEQPLMTVAAAWRSSQALKRLNQR